MKKRTKEENAAYARAQRVKKKTVSPVSPCAECEKLRIEIKKLTARLGAKEAKDVKESPADLFARTMEEKNKRFRKIGLMAHQGVDK